MTRFNLMRSSNWSLGPPCMPPACGPCRPAAPRISIFTESAHQVRDELLEPNDGTVLCMHERTKAHSSKSIISAMGSSSSKMNEAKRLRRTCESDRAPRSNHVVMQDRPWHNAMQIAGDSSSSGLL